MPQLRVMLLSTDLEKGGLPLRLVRLARHLRTVDVEPIVGCLARRGPLNDRLGSLGVETFSCDAAGPFDVRCLSALARLVRHLDPDLIHSSLFHANLAARLVGRIDRRRPLLTSTVTIETQRKWHLLVEALTCDFSDLHVANSEAVARHLRDDVGLSPERLRVIPNGLDLAEIDHAPPARRDELGLRGDVPLIVWAGRMDPVKNLETLIDVFAEVRRRAAVQLLLLGDGPQRARIQTRVAMRGLQSFVSFAGWSENVVGWIKTADLLLLPSFTEGSPNVVLEAMACGCPVVASDVPGCRELITPDETGSLCCSDDVRCFAREVLGLLEDPALRRRFAERALLCVRQRHDIQDVVVRWREAYDRLISQLST